MRLDNEAKERYTLLLLFFFLFLIFFSFEKTSEVRRSETEEAL